MLALPPHRDEAGAAKLLEMLGGVGEGLSAALGQHLDTPLALAEDLEEFEPMLVAERPRHGREMREQAAPGRGAGA
ncbi:hypothetical protein GCM10010964_02370 [Caldovatus sediminis]|uniref:Uncharacterized protein n=1 Tax=Caldovatus sediminis TaxID=2041189 RepID=A0A8J2Z7Y0_9PROT|nr:hypothetical protein GCM10010964_02370 [Caldovatus sediminis]